MRGSLLVLVAAALAACGGSHGSGPTLEGAGDAGPIAPDGGVIALYDDGLPSFLPLPPPGQYPDLPTHIAQIELTIDPNYLAALDADPTSDAQFVAAMTRDGIEVSGSMRYRGESTRTLPQKSFKFDLDQGHVDHRSKFDLLAEYLDSGKLAEKFSIDLRAAMGQRAPSGSWAQVSVNGKPNGFYLDMQKVHLEQLYMFGLETDAHVFTCGGRNCEMKIAPPGSYQQDFEYQDVYDGSLVPEMHDLLEFINRTDDADFESGIATRINLDDYLGCLAADALMSETIVEDAEGWWIHETHKDLWSHVPWDLNHTLMLWYRTWATTDPPIVNRDARVFTVYDDSIQLVFDERNTDPAYQPTWSVLNTRLWRRPALRGRILDKIQSGIAGPFSLAQAGPHLDALWAIAQPPLYQDPFLDQAHADVALPFYKSFLSGRASYLSSQLSALRSFQGPLMINEVGFGDATSPGYVELYNSSSAPIDLTGLAITDDLRAYKKQILPAGLTVPAGGYLRLIADGNAAAGIDHLAFTVSTSGGEIGLFDGTHVNRPFDLIYFGPHGAGTAYGRFPDGAEDYRAMPQTPGAANQ